MLTRRGFASCALCAITGFIATEASAQGTPPAASGGVTRKILSQTDGPAAGYETVLVEATIEAGAAGGPGPPSGNRIGLCDGRRLRAPDPGPGDPQPQARRCLPDPAEHASCGRRG